MSRLGFDKKRHCQLPTISVEENESNSLECLATTEVVEVMVMIMIEKKEMNRVLRRSQNPTMPRITGGGKLNSQKLATLAEC